MVWDNDLSPAQMESTRSVASRRKSEGCIHEGQPNDDKMHWP